MATLSYPATPPSHSPHVDLSIERERERLTPSAIRAFFNIMEHWHVRDEDARQLLGQVSNGKFYQLKKSSKGTLDQDRLLRVSYLVGIFKALNILYDQELADAWIQLKNQNRIFSGLTPLAYMTKYGVPGMDTVRRLLDARRGGQ